MLLDDGKLVPGAAFGVLGVEDAAPALESLAEFAVSHLTVLLHFHAFGVDLVIDVEQAHVSVEHHLLGFFLLWRRVNQDPLIFTFIATHSFLWAPTMSNHIPIVVIIENCLIFFIAPESIISRIFGLSKTKGVRTGKSSSERPCLECAKLVVVDVLNKDLLQVIATIFWIWHQAKIIWTLLNSFTAVSVLVAESCKQSAFLKNVIRVVVNGKRSSCNLSSKNHEVGNADLVAPLVIDFCYASLLKARAEASIVCILEIDAAVRASSRLTLLLLTEIHQIVTLKSQEARSVHSLMELFGLILLSVLRFKNLFCNGRVVLQSQLSCLQDFVFAAGEDLRWIQYLFLKGCNTRRLSRSVTKWTFLGNFLANDSIDQRGVSEFGNHYDC